MTEYTGTEAVDERNLTSPQNTPSSKFAMTLKICESCLLLISAEVGREIEESIEIKEYIRDFFENNSQIQINNHQLEVKSSFRRIMKIHFYQ
jgi:hypothetical protein